MLLLPAGDVPSSSAASKSPPRSGKKNRRSIRRSKASHFLLLYIYKKMLAARTSALTARTVARSTIPRNPNTFGAARRNIYIAPGDAKRHSNPSLAWFGVMTTWAAATWGLSYMVVSVLSLFCFFFCFSFFFGADREIGE